MTILEALKQLKMSMDGEPSNANTQLEALNEIAEANGGLSNANTISEAIKNIADAHVEVEKIEVTTQPTKTSYVEGQSFDPTGMVVTATYNGKTKVVTDYTISPSGALATTDTKVTITYGDQTAEVNITVDAKAVESIAVTTQPTKTTYTAGETFDPTGMVVTATYNDETTAVVDEYTFAPTEALATTDTVVTITYESKTATVAIVVNAE